MHSTIGYAFIINIIFLDNYFYYILAMLFVV